MTRHSGSHTLIFISALIPDYVHEHHRCVTLAIDRYYFQWFPYLLTIARKLKVLATNWVPNVKGLTSLKTLQRIIRLYHDRGFKITDIHRDGTFECLCEDLRPINLHINGANEHVPEDWRAVRWVKEGIRCVVQMLQFNRYTSLMMSKLETHTVCTKYQLSPQDGIFIKLSTQIQLAQLQHVKTRICILRSGIWR